MLVGYQQGTGIGCADSSFMTDLMLCEKAGFDVFEIRFDSLQRHLVSKSLADVKSFFASSRIKPHCMGGHFLQPEDLSGSARDTDIMTRFIAACHLAEQIGEHSFLIINHILQKMTDKGPVDITDTDYPYSRDEVTEFTVRILRRFCMIAADYGLNIAFEPTCGRGGSVKTMDHALQIINETGSDNIGLNLDSFNQYINGKNNDFSIYKDIPAEKIITVHINNCDDKPLDVLIPQDRRFCDSGAIDLDDFMHNLSKIGYTGPVSIEVLRPEYYAWPIERVISEAYRTTSELVSKYR